MARQVIDTTTNNGSYIGDPAKTAFEKTNANFSEIYAGDFIRTGNFTSTSFISSQHFTTTGGTAVLSSGNSGGQVILRPNGRDSGTGQVIVFTSGAVSAASFVTSQNVSSSGANMVVGSSGTGGQVFLRPNGVGSSTAEAILYPSGTMTAVQFTPTSSADVKDYIEGFSGDACSMIDRLVVITHQYRPDFVDSEKVYLSLLAENVKDVLPSATEGDFDVVENVDKEVIVNVEVPNEDGQGTHFEERVEIQSEQVLRRAPLGVSLMPMIALSIRAHQQKNRRIKLLEDELASIQQRLAALESVA